MKAVHLECAGPYEAFLECFRNNLLDVGIDPRPYGTHSFRRGGCQYLAMVLRWPIRNTCTWGGWSENFNSGTIFKYLLSWTDAPLIEPLLLSWTTGATIDVREGVQQYVKITDELMRYVATGHRHGILAEDVTHPDYDNDVRDDRRKEGMSRDVGKYWQIHVAPSMFCPAPGHCGIDPE